MRSIKLAAIAAVLTCAGAAFAQPAGTQFVSAGLDSGTANFLDANLNVISTFDTAGSFNGATVGAGQIFIGDFGISGWNIYDLNGNFQSTVSAGTLLQGMTYASGDILIHDPGTPSGPQLDLYTPNGTFVRTVATGVPATIEGLAFDGGNTVYAIENTSIEVYDFTTGALVGNLTNPLAPTELFGGTSITWFNNSLIVGGESGAWAQIDPATDTVINSGVANTDLYGLGVIPSPGAALPLIGVAGVAAIRRRR
jgi:hypothetical protein